MSEVRPLIISETLSAEPDQIGSPVSSGRESGAAIQNSHSQETLKKEKFDSIESEDDDIQLIFSAPRRRKKKKRRQRLDSSYSSITLSQKYQQFSKNISAARAMNANPGATNFEASAPASQASTSDRNFSRQQENSPKHNPSNNRHEQPQDTNFASNHTLPFSPSISRWNNTGLLSNRQSLRWNPPGIESGVSKRRRHEKGLNAGQTHVQYRQSPQLSPTSTPSSTFAPLGHPYSGIAFGPLETFGRIDHSSALVSSWPNLNWNECDVSAFTYNSPNPTNIPLHLETVPSPKVWANTVQDPFTTCRRPTKHLNIWIQPPERAPPTEAPEQTSPVLISTLNQQEQLQAQKFAKELASSEISVTKPTFPQDPFLRMSTTPQNKSVIPVALQISKSQEEIRPQPPLPTVSPKNSQIRSVTVQPADLHRKPSLYSIPVWPASPSQVTVPVESRELRLLAGNDHQVARTADVRLSSEPTLGRLCQDPHSSKPTQSLSLSESTIVPKATVSSPACLQAQVPRTLGIGTFQVPSARGSRKHSPNLIVDIAETSQEVFPFSTLAARHGVPVQKVFDTFTAIIQLPLLRNADDRRRHGELGKRRMRDYREAKKAMERAQEAGKKLRLRKIRIETGEVEGERVDEREVEAGLLEKAPSNRNREI